MRRLAALPWALVLVLVLAACGDEPEPSAGGGAPAGTTSTTAEPAPAEAERGSGCEPAEAPPAKPDGGARRPRNGLPPGSEQRVTVRTNCGDFTIWLDLASAPRTAASFVALAESGFYDDTVFHRIVPGFVIQGGDPTGSDPATAGSGGPGYKTRDVPPSDARYTRGVVAMAKAGDEAPGTAGSQFFVVTGADVGLPPEYAVLGKVTQGLDVVERIGRLGDAQEQPTEVVVVEGMTVRAT
jgi:cyclophilin family peptidyl-prolyl cis-trans isomerase